VRKRDCTVPTSASAHGSIEGASVQCRFAALHPTICRHRAMIPASLARAVVPAPVLEPVRVPAG
jgi:hypothetical protein